MKRLIGAACILFILAISVAMAKGPHGTPSKLDGQAVFRFDTFGDEQLWTNVLRMHEVIPAVDPATALSVGLKVDVDALPSAVIAALRSGTLNLADPAITVELLRLDAVVGVK